MAIVSVVGATGRQGLAQIKQLLNQGYEVRALSRNASPNLGEFTHKVQTRIMDIEDEASIEAAIEGSQYVFYNHPLNLNFKREELASSLGRASKKVGIERLVWNTASWIPDRPGDSHTYSGNTRGISALWETGVPATVFGAVLFMDNLLTDWARPMLMNEKRYIYPHAPEIGANWICLDDVAKVMMASLDRPDMVGSWMNIGGPERLTGAEVAATLSEAIGFELDYDPCTPEEFAQLLVEAMGDSVAEEKRKGFASYISEVYHYNNTSPTTPFAVNIDYMLDRLPEIKLETLASWAARQDWSGSGEVRPSGG
ncbi:MAG: SDR family oxidoreductase [Porticoccaceae bacterium]